MLFRPESRPRVGIVYIGNKCEKAVCHIVFKVIWFECVNISFEAGACVNSCECIHRVCAVGEEVREGVLKSTFWAYGVVRLLILGDILRLIVFVKDYSDSSCRRASVRPPFVCLELCGCQTEGESSGPFRLNIPCFSIVVFFLQILFMFLDGYRLSDGSQ